MVPHLGSLLEHVQGLLDQANVVGRGRVDETRWLLAIDSFLEVTMKKNILHVELVKWPATGRDDTQDGPDDGWFDNWTEGLIIVNTSLLVVDADNPAGLVMGKNTVRVVLKCEDPFDCHNIGTRRSRNKMPCVIVDERLVLLNHCCTSVQVS
jgi:hypothetical protein